VNHPPSTGPNTVRREAGPRPDGATALFLGKSSADKSQAAGNKEGRAYPLEAPGHNKLPDVGRHSAPGRGHGEKHDADNEDLAAAVQVSQRSANQKQGTASPALLSRFHQGRPQDAHLIFQWADSCTICLDFLVAKKLQSAQTTRQNEKIFLSVRKIEINGSNRIGFDQHDLRTILVDELEVAAVNLRLDEFDDRSTGFDRALFS